MLERHGTPWWLGLISELCNPIWWVSIGGIAAKFAKPLTKVPVLGSTSQKIAKGIQVAEAAPGKLAVKAVKEVAIKPTRHLLEKLPSGAELSGFLFKNDLFRNISQRTIGKVPWLKEWAPGTWLPSKLPEKLATKAEIEMAVGEEVLLRTSILEMGQSVKGQALASLRDLGTTKGLLGTKNAMCNPKLVKPRFEGESLALGDVVQAPERYIFRKKNAFEYCKRAQELCSHMYELATVQEGITIHKVALEPFEEYVHWVCTGVKNIHGDIQMLRRGTRAVGGIVPSMKPRRFENMVDGIRAGYKYGDDLEIYVGSYVQDMFKTIADTRFGEALANVVARVEGMLPTKPLERLAALFPERVLKWDAVKREMGDLGYAYSAANRAFRGEVLPEQLIRALSTRSPKLHQALEKALAKSGDARQFALAQISRGVKSKMNKVKPDWWKAKYARAEAMEIVKKPMPKYEEGYIRTATGYAHPLFQGQIYPRSIADMATKMLNDEAAAWLRVSSQISQTIRLQVAALDVSAGMIQGFVAHGAHPIAAIRGQIGAIKAMVSPRTFAHFCQQHADTIAEMTYYGGGPKSFEYFEGLGVLQRYLGKLPPAKWALGQTYGRMEAAFSAWGTITRVNMWEAAAKHWIKRGQGFEYARYLQRLTGIMSFQQLGMPASRRAILSAFVSFAPQYRFSILSYMADVFKGGMTGNAVRADLAKLVAAGTTAYVAFCLATDNPIYLNPLKDGKRFMSINIDDHWVGMGGGVVSTMRAFADITASALSIGMDEPMDFLTIDKWQNPLIRAIFMQASPLTGIISELAARRDFLGYPMESPEDWLLWAGEQLTPIWLQDILFDKSGVPYSPLAILGEFVGLRTSPQTRWETLDDRIRAVKAWESVSDLTDEQRQRIEKGESILSVLDRFQKAELFNAFPELEPYYEEAIVDALTRDSQTRKNYEASMTNIRDELIDSLTKGLEVGVKLDGEDTRWLRGRYSDVMSVYGAKNDIIRESPEYQDMFAEWEESRDKREPDAELFDLAYWDYIENVVAPDYETLAGDFDWEAYEGALKAWKDHWGEDFYQKVLYVLENNKADFPEWAVKLWKDKIALNESGYWKVGVSTIGDAIAHINRARQSHIPVSGIAIDEWNRQWIENYDFILRVINDIKEKRASTEDIEKAIEILILDIRLDEPVGGWEKWKAEQEAAGVIFGEDHVFIHQEMVEGYKSIVNLLKEELGLPIEYTDERIQLRLKNSEIDAMLALWGYGGKLQTWDAYNFAVQWAKELGIPLEQLGMGLPPHTLMRNYFDLNEIVKQTSGSSIEAKLYKLEHPEYLAWGLEQEIWSDDLSGENINELRLRVQHKDSFELYDSYGDWESENYIDDEADRRAKRQEMLERNTEFQKARYAVDGYNLGLDAVDIRGITMNLLDEYVEYRLQPTSGDWRERFRLAHGNLDSVLTNPEIMGNDVLKPIKEEDVMPLQYDALYEKHKDEFELYESYGDWQSPNYIEDSITQLHRRL